MLVFQIRHTLALMLMMGGAVTAFAQQTGGVGGAGFDTGQTAQTGTATGGTGTLSGNEGGGGAAAEFNAETAFAAVERGDTVGATGNTGTGFSDLSAANAGGARGAGGGLGGGGFGGLGALGSLFGGGFNTGAGQTTKPTIRTRLRSAISAPPMPPARVQQVATQRFRTLPGQAQRGLGGINVTMQGRTAVISGSVGSERDRRMSEMLMRLEPGVSKIDNRVVVLPQ